MSKKVQPKNTSLKRAINKRNIDASKLNDQKQLEKQQSYAEKVMDYTKKPS